MEQIIDEESHVVPDAQDFMNRSGITKAGDNYHIVSIIGPQSSGKSTLLNHMFGTNFTTMDETTGRQQTTKGIHASFVDQKILVFDIEGSDSRERGDAEGLFERKAALFALAMSEVVIINMWHNDVGRYNGSSFPLLKTVFEVNIQLFSAANENKCQLLFVIRDIAGEPKVIESQVRRDLELIWGQLTLPKEFFGKTFDDFFIFRFFALPHYRLKHNEFLDATKYLKGEFFNENQKDYLFAEPLGRVIPGDGLYQYISNVWESINENKELNLPSQKRTLSNFRCEEFANEAYKIFDERSTKEIGYVLEEGNSLNNFNEVSENIIHFVLDKYNRNSCRYVQEVVEEKLDGLKSKIGEKLLKYYEINCSLYIKMKENEFHKFIDNLPNKLSEFDGWEQKANEHLKQDVSSIQDFVHKTIVGTYHWEFDFSSFEADNEK